MYIVHFIATNFVGGPEKQILSHLDELRAANTRLLLISFAESGGYELQRQSAAMGIRCELLPAHRGAMRSVLRDLLRLYRAEHPSVVCAHGYKATFYALLLKLLTGSKVVSFSRGWTAENTTVKFYGWLDRLIIRFSDRIVAVSHAQQARLRRVLVPARKIRVVHNASTRLRGGSQSGRDIRDELGLASDSLVVLTAGRLSPEKGHADLLLAAARVLASPLAYPVHFVVAGDGPLEAPLRAQAASLGIADQVHFLGFRKDLDGLYRCATMFALPSLSEGLPNVLLEAMAASLPVVSTAVGGVPELVEHRRSGLLARPGEPDDLARQIVHALSSPELRARLRLNALDLVRTEFSKERQARLLVDVYEEVASG